MERWFTQLLEDITSLKIQGAEHVAREAVKGLARLAKERASLSLQEEARLLLATRPTEPMMRNAIHYYLSHATKGNHERLVRNIIERFDRGDQRIADYASTLLKEEGTYFTHCHSSTVMAAFHRAKEKGKRLSVHNTETRPRYQGRVTATELAAAGIPVTHGVDSAARLLLKGCDAVLLGADALLKDGKAANKIGSEMIAELAHARRIPVYILAHSWKFEPFTAAAFKERLERRDPKNVWERSPRGVRVLNHAFEFIEPRFITAIITEQGIRDPYTCARELLQHQALLFPTKNEL